MKEVRVVGKTKAGKEIGYRVPDGKNLYEIAFKSGGEVPRKLHGGWNDIRQMEIAINRYIDSTDDRVKQSKAKKSA